MGSVLRTALSSAFVRTYWPLILAVGLVVGGLAVTPVVIGDGYPLDSESGGDVAFTDVAAEVGFEYDASAKAQFGNTRGGVYVSDYTNNGYPDVLALGGEQPVLYENSGGSFEPSGELSRLGADRRVKTGLFFDYDNDGWSDLLLLRVGGSPVFFENERGNLTRTAVGFRDLNLTIPVGATAADYDDDGCLDVFIAQNGDWRYGVPRKEQLAPNQGPSVDPARMIVESDTGNPNLLLEGNCETFSEVTDDAGIAGRRWSTATSFVDVTGNGYPDIHVANDYNYDILYVNHDGSGFESRRIDGTNRNGMASEVVDVNQDGAMDIFVSNVYWDEKTWTDRTSTAAATDEGNNLLINTGNGSFDSREIEYGVYAGGWAWGVAAVDLTNNGYRDIVQAEQSYRNYSERSDLTKTYPNLWLRENRTAFEKVNASEYGFSRMEGRGVTHLDYDRDGDQDIVVADIDGRFKLYENGIEGGNWLQIDLEKSGPEPVLGARIVVTTEERKHHLQETLNTDFQAQDSRVHHVGLGAAESATVTVEWEHGETDTFESVSANQRVTVYANGTLAGGN